ncbi:hypothetical protein B0H11DRAFT_2235850 [Mycena galericulata]|nr:hypothetical protein B0H11DRAFT_2235850 [Mycena galericulata]
MRPLPSPPTSAPSVDSSFRSMYATPSTAQSFTVQFPIGVEISTAVNAPRPSKARRREGRIFTHSASSSMSSFDPSSSCSIISAEFWMVPQDVITIPMEATFLTDMPPNDESKAMPPTPKAKQKSKPANIIIPRTTPTATVVSPTSPAKPASPAVSFPTISPEAVTMPCTPRTPLSPLLSPLTPNRRIQSPNARIRKLAKLTRTLGENIPVELVFPSGKGLPVSYTAAPASPRTVTVAKRAKTLPDVIPFPPAEPRLMSMRSRASPAHEWPLTPTPDYTFDTEAHKKTAVGLHYALGMNSIPMRAVALVRTSPTPVLPSSPPPFSSTFTMDDVSWEHARQAVLGPRVKGGKKGRRALGGVRKAPVEANGRGTWRKKENTWSGEWNVEDMEELQLKLRRLR